ncbi:DUF6308 family protein [Amycolatopsis sp. H20-H5]|uniref:DUF6308 family protein n=1 Tax=Amycolatopsis sp. H20-H5 TaxID=3046309 RepID=UPI002DB7D6E7|nr:DUF6308 family protein [Amycolatopsis sp. H20-H5]MEC3978194.1 DUF6308 family protein [Amycolatopsis sp. H20-H5]
MTPTGIAVQDVPDVESYRPQHQFLDQCVRGDGRTDSVRALQRYFNQDPTVGGLYAGRGFERFDSGGDAAAVRDQITAADVLALTFLSITDRLPQVALAVTVANADRITDLLRQIPADVTMHEVGWAVYAPDSPASELWRFLKQCGGKDRWVAANKLLARKRPHLLPVYDSKVQALLNRPDSIWACLWTWFDSDPSRTVAVAELRSEAGGIEDISLLRCVDVILWMQAMSGSLSRRRTDPTTTNGPTS